MIKKYVKKPVVIEAVKHEHSSEVIDAIKKWAGRGKVKVGGPGHNKLLIKTLEGEMMANVGDYIIKGVKGEVYPCKPDIFEMTYAEICSNCNKAAGKEKKGKFIGKCSNCGC